MNEDVRDFFKEINESFTIYVVEHRFAIGRGLEYFKSFKGKVNYIDTDTVIKKRLNSILNTINKNIPDTGNLIKSVFNINSPIGIVEAISSLSKIFTTTLNQAAGPDVIDPIILQEGKILPKYLNQIISLHQSSILRPIIIVLLNDNDFDRVKNILSDCPHDTNIKMIRNNGETIIYKVINKGADNIDIFLDSFSHQLFSTCSNTKRDILYNEEWAEKSVIKLFGPTLMQMRSSILFNDKTLIREPLNKLIANLCLMNNDSDDFSLKTLLSFECMARLFRVFCNDGGKDDIEKAHNIAKYLDNDILLAHVYRNSYFLNESYENQQKLLDIACSIFEKNNMKDHAIYSLNNKLVEQYEKDNVAIECFLSLQSDAVHNVPGLVGMSHIYNNTGVIHLVNGYPENSIDFFTKGLDYAYRPDRSLQKISLLCNRMMALNYCNEKINENELRKIMNLIFDNKEIMNLPFIAARYVLNVISLAFNVYEDFALDLIENYNIEQLIQCALNENILGSGQILLHLQILEDEFTNFNITKKIKFPKHTLDVVGKRKDYLVRHGYNPFVFSTWF
jgi:aspartate carbamoyltransferase regulatory subunit